MANKNKKNDSDPLLGPTVDPKTEEKLDAMLSLEDLPETTKKKELEQMQATSPASAPLIPNDKLPNFEDKSQNISVDEPIESPEEISPDPVVATESQLDKADVVEAVETVGDKMDQFEAEANSKLDDPATDKAVDDILIKESDELLSAHDHKVTQASALNDKVSIKQKIVNFFRAWWGNTLARRATIAMLLLAIVAAVATPNSRYFILNSFGVRSSSSVIILDQKSTQPLKNVEVRIANQQARTDIEGKVTLTGLKLGNQTLTIKKPAFADVEKKITLGWGSNPLGEITLTPVGSQYTFKLSDFVSDKPIKRAEATSNEASAVSNENGEIILTMPNSKDTQFEVSISAENYRTEKITLEVANKQLKEIKMVPAHKLAFVSKRSGKYDLYKIDVDGKNEQKILAGTGTEREDSMAIVPHLTKNIVAFVSSRGNTRNQDGYVLNSLNIIDLDTNEVKKIADSERIQIIGWQDNRLVFVKVAQGASAASSDRHKLVSYDLEKDESKELASTNYFNDVMLVRGTVYYSPALYKVNGPVGLFKVNADGSNKQTISDKEVWNLFRTSYDNIAASVGQDWYDYKISDNKFTHANNPPAQLKSRVYTDGPSNKLALWTEDRDGKGVLLSYDISANKDDVLFSRSGLKGPLQWLDNDHVVFRVSNEQESADYVMSLAGGEPKKVANVTNIAGLDRWYYY